MNRSQYALRFNDLVGVNNQSDYVQYLTFHATTEANAPRLTVTYTTP